MTDKLTELEKQILFLHGSLKYQDTPECRLILNDFDRAFPNSGLSRSKPLSGTVNQTIPDAKQSGKAEN